MTPIAGLSPRREVWTVDRLGRRVQHGGLPDEAAVVWGEWGVQASAPSAFSWPTWAPDCRSIACFRLPDKEHRHAALFRLDTDGIVASELLDFEGRLPIYLQWSPAGDRIAVLSQQDGELVLTTVPADGGAARTLARGSPLFFTWAGPNRVAAFVGGNAARVEIMDPTGRGRSEVLPGQPGNFCAPLWIADRVVYVRQDVHGTAIVTATTPDEPPQTLEHVTGLVALLGAPDGRHILRAVAPKGDGSPYRDLAILDVRTGEVRDLPDLPCLACVWLPGSDGLLVARVDTDRNVVEWLRLDLDGRGERLVGLYPTRDQAFYLRFFEQYHQSHRIVDPSGRYLLLSGAIDGRGDADSPARIWRIEIATGEVEEIEEGLFAVYGT